MYKLEQFQAKYHHNPASGIDDNFEESESGYWILPNGDLVSLCEPMSHGKVAATIDNTVFDDCMKEASRSEGISHFKAMLETTATYKRGWFRINFSPYNNDINCDWSRVTPEQLKTLDIVLDMHDPEQAGDYWYTGGPGTYKELKAKIKETQGNK